MSYSGFQTEPSHRPSSGVIGVAQPTAATPQLNQLPTIEALLLGLHFRDWLCESELIALEQMVSPPSQLVLLYGETLLYPEDVASGVSTAVESTALHQPDTIFTHRIPPVADGMPPRLLHTALIGEIRGRELLLGLCEPERRWERAPLPLEFTHLVEDWRATLRAAAETAAVLDSRIPSDQPYLAVNRASGRVIVAREQLCHLLGCDSGSVTGIEYSMIAGRLRSLMTSRGLHFDNISVGDIHVSVVSLLPERRRKPRGAADQISSDFLVHSMRNKVSAICAASGELRSLTPLQGSPDCRVLADIITSEAAELNRLVDGLDLLSGARRRHTRCISVLEATREAAGEFEQRFGRPVAVAAARGFVNSTIEAPVAGIPAVIDAILRAHSAGRADKNTAISIGGGEYRITIEVATHSEKLTSPSAFRSPWCEYAKRLADCLGFECVHTTADGNRATTTITIPVEGLTHD
ncbi:MAG: hypothetical protein AB1772_12360 [Candidatus Zixiibacteriota bacterium]